MRSLGVVADELLEKATRVSDAENDQVIQTFASDRSDHARLTHQDHPVTLPLRNPI
jgi:hypothetical protein